MGCFSHDWQEEKDVGQLTFGISNAEASDKEDVTQVIRELSKTCNDCRLCFAHPTNRGLIWKGNHEGKIAIIGEAPGDTETERGIPLVGVSGKEFDRWCRFINLDHKECLITNTVQCQPTKHKVDGRMSQKPPDKDEIKACFGNRALRILKAMPNLEVVVTLGWVAAKALLGGEPKGKTHEGRWYATSLLPGIPIFCLPHPSFLLREPTPEKTGKVEQCLLLFKREYLETGKILKILEEQKNSDGSS